jgi:hypothetical protein
MLISSVAIAFSLVVETETANARAGDRRGRSWFPCEPSSIEHLLVELKVHEASQNIMRESLFRLLPIGMQSAAFGFGGFPLP